MERRATRSVFRSSMSPGAFERWRSGAARMGFSRGGLRDNGDGGSMAWASTKYRVSASRCSFSQALRRVPQLSRVRDFRGAMQVWRQGALITTGTSRTCTAESSARRRATVDLIDGNRALHLLRSMRIGVTTPRCCRGRKGRGRPNFASLSQWRHAHAPPELGGRGAARGRWGKNPPLTATRTAVARAVSGSDSNTPWPHFWAHRSGQECSASNSNFRKHPRPPPATIHYRGYLRAGVPLTAGNPGGDPSDRANHPVTS